MPSRTLSIFSMRLLAFLFFYFTVASAQLLKAQDSTRVLSRLPDKAGIYLWTDDFPGLLKQIESWPWPVVSEESGEDNKVHDPSTRISI